MSLPLQIGITGGIGSGKSVVCKLFSCLGIPVYNADSRAKWLTNHNPRIIESVIALLGNESYTREGNYNTAYVGSLVFDNEELLKKLNAIIHPVVMQDTTDWVGNHSGLPYVVKEAAIMNKAGDRNSLDYVVVVEAPLELRITRILQRDRRSEAEIRAIVKRQVSDEERKKVGDFFIKNDEESALIPQVLMLHDIFKTGKRSH
ncbi:dephospho-CoA kinase [Dyadobacter sp. LJ53]|uniref:dephospho-CoA kinase n=1 Tax=Dyadobacter chenwenxiniae TaxID=2906456 RepID=UPI001EE9BC5B|nr:dephospho-CoA kinase [Dyadobacter chenwenxiniae]MCF0053314.1 dephospho-CoA kinase [Dyadobacter chenwenxiniae]